MRQDEEFAPLRIVKKNLTDFDRCAYRVYKSPAEYITVEAATALEAFRESGIQNPLRIVRETRFMERLVDQNRFTELEELIETGVIMQAPEAITGHSEPVPQAVQQSAVAKASVEDAAAFVTEEYEAAAAPQAASPGAPAEAEVVDADDSELSEEDIHSLLGDEEKQRANDATAGEDGLSPDDVAQLLQQDAKKS